MSTNSAIEWTDHTFNPWIGCTKVSPACDHCYAERSMPARFRGILWGPHERRVRTSDDYWELPKRWNAQHEAFFNQHGRRQRVFCASLADVFDNVVAVEWLADLLGLVRVTRELDWLLLSKRIGNWRDRLVEVGRFLVAKPDPDVALAGWIAAWLDGSLSPRNVWIGATVTSQAEADRDIPKLLAVPARVRFLSMEPLLEAVGLDHRLIAPIEGTSQHGQRFIDWVIAGGESGPGARPMHPDWARSLRDQCQAAGVPFFFKQWGEWMQVAESPVHPEATRIPGNLCRVQSIGAPDRYVAISTNGGRRRYEIERVGKKAAGRLLDGRTWDEVPS